MSLGKVLFIEDEAALAEIVKENLQSKGFDIMHAATLSKASQYYRTGLPDLIIADVMMPDGSGFDWVRELRRTDQLTPVIFLTARSQTDDIVQGFELGGNDYLKKPFSIAELIVRMKSLLKKDIKLPGIAADQPLVWKLSRINFHYPAGELESGIHKVQLTSREADLLLLLLQNRNQALNRNDALKKLWGNTDYFSGRSLDVFISKLRKYLAMDPKVKIVNIRGQGYKLVF